MKKLLADKFTKIFFIYICVLLLLIVYATFRQFIFRKYFRVINEVIIYVGIACILIRRAKRFSEKGKAYFSSILIIVIACMAFGARLLFDTDKESVVFLKEEKKIRVESSFIMYYEVNYYDYANAIWYKAFPRIEENYDDGDPDQWIYTDYYDENGELIERVFAE